MTARLYYMDAMRSILMLLGVALHAASIYKVEEIWLIQDQRTWAGFDFLTQVIHQFRMPAFFIIAGYFSHHSLARYGPEGFLKKRLHRILIPLLVCGLTLNTLQILILHGPAAGLALMSDPAYWYDGGWVYHLWFLNCLILYFLLAALIYACAGNSISRIYQRFRPSERWTWGGLYLLLLPLITYGVIFLNYRLTESPEEPQVMDFLLASMPWKYSTYFIFGFFLGANKAFREDFSRPRPWLIAAVIAAYYLAFHHLPGQEGLPAKIGQRYTAAFVPWGLCAICFYFFQKFMNKSPRIFSYLSDASYSVYLFHQLFVIVFGLILIGSTLHPLLKFSIVTGLTLAASLSIHHFAILRSGFLGLLFNGRTMPIAQKLHPLFVSL